MPTQQNYGFVSGLLYTRNRNTPFRNSVPRYYHTPPETSTQSLRFVRLFRKFLHQEPVGHRVNHRDALAAVVQCSLHPFNIPILCQQIHRIHLCVPNAGRRSAEAGTPWPRASRLSTRPVCSCASSHLSGSQNPNFPAILRISASKPAGSPTIRRFPVFCSVIQKRGAICADRNASTSPTRKPVCMHTHNHTVDRCQRRQHVFHLPVQ